MNNAYCAIPDSLCIDFSCQCKSNFVQSSDQCVLASLGKSCKDNYDCRDIKNGLCSRDKFCACKDDYLELYGYECTPKLGGYCATNADCHFYSSLCFDNKCQCKSNFTAVSTSQCVLSSTVNSCNQDLDCGEPWHSICSDDKKCICKSNSIASNRWTCLPTLGGYCWKDDQCVTKNAVCIDFHCECNFPFVRISNTRCTHYK
ncbi:rh5-interacting protein-like [Microplitis mediator]|uniref:rh5-interacting protein-like n=1 Tax=Microplitis mediator TaxID=375433 RepID=UPI002554A8CE|nr:rh5-interacting protein-like [Microplitis mediator]